MNERAWCKSCAKEVIWIVTRNGKKMPLDAASEERRFVIDGTQDPMVAHMRKTYLSHFATCPQGPQHRKPR